MGPAAVDGLDLKDWAAGIRLQPREQLEHHLVCELLPLWLSHGVDERLGVFHGRLGGSLEPAPDPERRLLVQARMLYTLAHAGLEGPSGFEREVEAAFHGLRDRFLDPRHGGFFLTIDASGAPLDTRKDAYAHAFVLLALAFAARVGPGGEAGELAARSFELCDARLRDPRNGGWLEGADAEWRPASGRRRQNPHMHLLEALLALHQTQPEPVYLERADEIVELLETRWRDPQSGALLEHFESDWTRDPDSAVEPGHHFEWAWLLERYAELREAASPRELARGLFAFADRHGVDAEHGGVYDEIAPDGTLRRDTKRLWPQTEYLRALTTRAAAECGGATRCLPELLRLSARYRDARHPGWHEHASREGAITSAWMRATSVYHVFTSLLEVGRFLR